MWHKKMTKIMVSLAAAGLFFTAACSQGAPKKQESTAAAVQAAEEKKISPEETDIRELVSSMTTEEKLAQMMMVAFRSNEPGAEAVTEIGQDYAEILTRYDFGGVILFAPNIADTAQTVKFIHDCQTAAMASDKGIPLFVALDQEGGLVNRVAFGSALTGNMALAAGGETSLAEESARILGEEIHAMGFNVDFAPVADVNSNPENPVIGVRSFSDDPQTAASFVRAYMRGMKEEGVSTTLKHFPGHGNVAVDSHSGLPCSDYTMEELQACDLVPFAEGIEEGTDFIMTAHIQYPEIEKETYVSQEDGKEIFLPATLSRAVLTGILREKMGYDGIIVTDALDMNSIAAHFDPIDAAVLSINAGTDILLMPVNLYKDEKLDSLSVMDDYMKELAARVESGEVKEEELDDSVIRILEVKKKQGVLSDTGNMTAEEMIAESEAVVGSAEHHRREWEIAQACITLLKNENDALPIAAGSKTLIWCPDDGRKPAAEYAAARLAKEGLADSKDISIYCGGETDTAGAEMEEAVQEADCLVLMSQSVLMDENIRRLLTLAEQYGKKTVLMSLRLPYDTALYEDADAVLCAYNNGGSAHDEEGNGPFNLNVAAAVCSAFGQSVPRGTLPVNIPKISVEDGDAVFEKELLYERGEGLQNWGK